MNTLQIRQWETPASYPTSRVGVARISRRRYARGHYPMEGVGGYTAYQVTKAIFVTNLVIRNRCYMVDDPLHWYSMAAYVARAQPGHLLCAGLGLGLAVWHALKRLDLTKITVVEIEPDVIGLVSPHLPNDPRLEIVQADFYAYRPDDPPDTVLWDLAVGNPDATFPQMVRGVGYMELVYPSSLNMCFGSKFFLGLPVISTECLPGELMGGV